MLSRSKGTSQIISGHNLLERAPWTRESRVSTGILGQVHRMKYALLYTRVSVSAIVFREHEVQGVGSVNMGHVGHDGKRRMLDHILRAVSGI